MAEKITIRFENVGRAKKCWGPVTIEATGDELIKQVLKHGALASRDIDVTYDLDEGKGNVYAGGRPVGTVVKAEVTP